MLHNLKRHLQNLEPATLEAFYPVSTLPPANICCFLLCFFLSFFDFIHR